MVPIKLVVPEIVDRSGSHNYMIFGQKNRSPRLDSGLLPTSAFHNIFHIEVGVLEREATGVGSATRLVVVV